MMVESSSVQQITITYIRKLKFPANNDYLCPIAQVSSKQRLPMPESSSFQQITVTYARNLKFPLINDYLCPKAQVSSK